ncbi:hypothetical protein Z948_792 [Sulfitobacter donghicola DSW-25 = KCTC 12864 = JCM 14565]|uniref:Uncharacterized protein n=1 Tax=Sulfitobacter donghicola DSW-25 = KCTC 12864 = JCM 14565 TaxID=1300350 RepID=A0A073IY36_9RHOB|nr:hypothetical protein DSW25_06175 [Sulfitobacter donghicola DSW-25 = KCTC 12864 = JCM 14565]KIN67087.1 hypothetical protein Z948_792 [Sulfitobacter donghicola DSW-25 = KCTC 12864 = JCM 14565]
MGIFGFETSGFSLVMFASPNHNAAGLPREGIKIETKQKGVQIGGHKSSEFQQATDF